MKKVKTENPLNKIPDWLKKLSATNIIAQQKAFSQTKFCASPNCSNNNFQWCHVISESNQLKQISESNKVSWIQMREKDRFTLHRYWTDTPIANALVFRGFCNNCDNNLFIKIDSKLKINKETALLLSYRAISYMNWRNEVDLTSISLEKEIVLEMLSKNPELPTLNDEFESNHRQRIIGATVTRDNVANLMNSIRDAVENKNFDFIKTKVFDFKEDLPIRYSVSGSMANSLLYEHVPISQIEHPQTPMYFFHILNEEKTTKLIFSWLSTIPTHFAMNWINKLECFSKSGHLSDILMRFAFINNHGLAFKPSLYKEFGIEGNHFLTTPLYSQMYHGLKPEITRVCNPPYLNFNWMIEDVTEKYLKIY